MVCIGIAASPGWRTRAREIRLSTFEYVSVVHSIVLALGMARALGGVADIARVWSQLASKWFFVGWLILLLIQLTGWWFGLWARFEQLEEIRLLTFFGWLLVPASLYVASRLLIPEFPEGAPPDLEQRFADVRIPFFACLAISPIPALPDLQATPEPQWLLGLYCALGLAGVLISDRRRLIGLLFAMLLTLLTFLALARSTLGG